jgi:GNAT superfamily N-acetyltransferase
MRACLHDDATGFLVAADPFFRSDPFTANVIAVVAARTAAESGSDGQNNLWATVEDGVREVLGVAMHTPPHSLFVSRMPDLAAVTLADALADVGRELPGVNGACHSTSAFAARWTVQTGRISTVVTAMRMYRLEELSRPQRVSGRPSLASAPDDVARVAGWLAAFHDEAIPHAPIQDWSTFAARRIADGQMHLWHDGGKPVSLAAVSAPAGGVARVGPVYTPPQSRRRGYGAAITAEASASAMADGAQHIVLYADLANPTSNSIYQAIGYKPDHDANERAFH